MGTKFILYKESSRNLVTLCFTEQRGPINPRRCSRHFLWHVSRQSGRNDHSCYPEGHNKREESWLSLSDSLCYWSTFLLRWEFDTIVLAKYIWPPSLQTDSLSHTYTHTFTHPRFRTKNGTPAPSRAETHISYVALMVHSRLLLEEMTLTWITL